MEGNAASTEYYTSLCEGLLRRAKTHDERCAVLVKYADYVPVEFEAERDAVIEARIKPFRAIQQDQGVTRKQGRAVYADAVRQLDGIGGGL